MRDFIKRLFPLQAYPDPIARFRATATYVTSTATLVAILLTLVGFGGRLISPANSGDSFYSFVSIVIVALTVAALLTLLATRFGRRETGALLIILSWVAPAWGFIVVSRMVTTDFWLGFALLIVGITLTALLIGPRMVVYITAASVLVLCISALNQQPSTTADIIFSLVLYALLLLIQALITYSLARGLPHVVQQVVSERDQRRLRLAEASNAITQRLLATRLDLDALLKEAVVLVGSVSADVNNAQIFMVDEDRRNATLVASTAHASTEDQMTLGQQVGIGSLSVIGRATITGQTILVRDTTEDRAYRRSAFLQGTRVELALPLRVGNNVIGVLDIQSNNSGAFPADDVKSLETLSNLIAIVVDDARLYADAQKQLAENSRLFEQTRNSLREIERLNRQLTGSAWSEYLRAQGQSPAYTINLASGQVEDVADWTSTMAEASRRNQITVRQNNQAKVVAMPISVRGQAIGAMEFEIAADQDVSSEQMAVLQQVVERLGLAVENTRLFEETQRIAQREALVNEISSRMQVTTNVEAVIAAATQGLADAFHAPRVSIRLGSPNHGQSQGKG